MPKFTIAALVALLGSVIEPCLAGQEEYQVQLLDRIGTDARAGVRFHARIKGPLSRQGRPALPAGTIIGGVVRTVHSIGIGLRRERAAMELEFGHCRLPDGRAIDCEVDLVSVDNAREQVVGKNGIEGIRAGSHLYSWIGGMWIRPLPGLLRRAPIGLTGAGGMIQSNLAPHPCAAMLIVGARLLFFRMPEPEVVLPAGSELIVKITAEAGENTGAAAGPGMAESVLEALGSMPAAVDSPSGKATEDLINFAFAGSRADLEQAFAAAGWHPADPMNARTARRVYSAFASMRTYPTAPVSALHYEGQLPGLVFQKSFNSLAKRHHIRLWAREVGGKTLWLGAATQDIAIGVDWSRMNLTHRIDPNLDRERNVILNDLLDAGCVAGWTAVGREREKRKGKTDGALALAALRPCEARRLVNPEKPKRRPVALAAVRRVVLETRQYFLRGNPYYWGYRAVRWGVAEKRAAAGTGQGFGVYATR
jgi:hypothetical protein